MNTPQEQAASLQAGLRELALDGDGGLSVDRLHRALEGAEEETPEVRMLVERASTAATTSQRRRAAGLRRVIIGEIDEFPDAGNPMWTNALRAAFKLNPDLYRDAAYDTLDRRLDQARANGDFGPDASQDDMRRHWDTGVRELAQALNSRLTKLAEDPPAWAPYLKLWERDLLDDAPSDTQPVFVTRQLATYRLRGRILQEAMIERTITAAADHVNYYTVRASSPLGEKDRVQISAVLNCRPAGPKRTKNESGRIIHERPMLLANRLMEGEESFFATSVSGQRNKDPIVEIVVTNHGIRASGLTLRVQFDRNYHPAAAWWFAECGEDDRTVRPSDGDPRRLRWTTFGYLTHTFTQSCRPGARYGLAWQWHNDPL
jgi:hypothetical protein